MQSRRGFPTIEAVARTGMKVKLIFDQSTFVRAALQDVVQEAVTAALLVALMVLVFLGSPRSMLIVITSIPLSILTAIIALKLTGQTINTMTLGGIALAVGMLVDDATVEVENIHRNQAMHKPLLVAILDGASQIATPTLVGTLCICIVFFPVVLLTGVARFLFTPLALAVVFAMLTSYLLSRTLVTTMARYLLPEDHHQESHGGGSWGRFLDGFERGFERLRTRYHAALTAFIARRAMSLTCVALIIIASGLLLRVVGEDFFPAVDAGMMRLHVLAPTGTRVEDSEYIVDRIERSIRKIIPPSDLETISDNIGLPVFYDLAFYQTDSIGPMDTDIQIQLKEKHRPTAMYQDRIRRELARQFPGVTTYFQAADIIAQVLNFGLSSAIDVQVSGNDLDSDYAIAERLEKQMRDIPGVADLRVAEPLDYPANYWLQQVTDARNQILVAEQVVPQQTADNSHAAMLQARAAYEQLCALQSYEVIRAETDGVITARDVDRGALIPQVTSPGGSTPIVELATLHPLRIYADVPQDLAAFVKDGDAASISVTQYPNRSFLGKVTRHPEALAQDTRTMRVEVDLPNNDSALYPGMYATLSVNLSSSDDAPRISDDALIFRDGEAYAPVVRNDRIHLAPI
jgi:multidrug efflux pump subunit AcrB